MVMKEQCGEWGNVGQHKAQGTALPLEGAQGTRPTWWLPFHLLVPVTILRKCSWQIYLDHRTENKHHLNNLRLTALEWTGKLPLDT